MRIPFFLAITLSLLDSLSPLKAELSVVSSIAPINSLVSGVTGSINKPETLIPVGASPHHYALRPSNIRLLNAADLIIWVGKPLESFLARPLSTLPRQKRILTLIDTPGLTFRYPPHGHGNGTALHDNEGKNHPDPHIWLSPDNAIRIIRAICRELIRLDVANTQAYTANARHMEASIKRQEKQLNKDFKPLTNKPFIVYHDAYRYFTDHYNLNQIDYIVTGDESMPGAKRLISIRKQIRKQAVNCIFQQPNTSRALTGILIQDSDVHIKILDPLGTHQTENALLYTDLIQQLADTIISCLGKS